METSWPTMEERGPTIDEHAIVSFERRFNLRLPEDYRDFLLAVNGGILAEENMSFARLRVTDLLSLGVEDYASSLTARAERAHFVLPHPDLLMIGNAEGSMILLAVRGDHRGEVWSLDTVDPRPEGSNPRVLWHDQRDMTKLADSFEEFVQKLQPLE